MSGPSFNVRRDLLTSVPINHIYYTRKGSLEGTIIADRHNANLFTSASLFIRNHMDDCTDSRLCRYLVWPLVILMTSIITICTTTWERRRSDGPMVTSRFFFFSYGDLLSPILSQFAYAFNTWNILIYLLAIPFALLTYSRAALRLFRQIRTGI